MFRERRERSHSIGRGEGILCRTRKLWDMKPMVHAKNDPAIVGIFPHCDYFRHKSWAGGFGAEN